jgi:fructokinase
VSTGDIIIHDNKTPIAIAVLDNDNNARYTFYKSNIPFPAYSPPQFHPNDIFAFGSFYSIDPRSYKFIHDMANEAKRVGALVFYDPNIRLSKFKGIKTAHQYLSKNISLADIVRASDDDMAAISHAKNHKEAYEWVKQAGCETLIYTCNKEGVWLLTGQYELFFKVPTTKVASTIGAGDSFNAGAIFSIIANEIKKDDLNTLSADTWKGIIENAITIATEVCKTYDNYLPQEFANKMVKKQ